METRVRCDTSAGGEETSGELWLTSKVTEGKVGIQGTFTMWAFHLTTVWEWSSCSLHSLNYLSSPQICCIACVCACACVCVCVCVVGGCFIALLYIMEVYCPPLFPFITATALTLRLNPNAVRRATWWTVSVICTFFIVILQSSYHSRPH